jgi:peptidoglycan glycosyltransferase
MVTNFAALGVLASIHANRGAPIDFAPFRVPVRWLGLALGAAALALLAIVANVQIVHADDYVVKPHLGVQADGARRFAYNPRVLDIVRTIPRGTVYDRAGLPLATDDGDVIANARAPYQKLGVALAEACADKTERCYPLGGRAFHLIGDARTRVNWTAPNTSYVERDAESTLRGFDDHASTVVTHDVKNRPALALKRDYRAIVPLLRHRYDPKDETVVSFRNRPRDVRLTIDAGFQLRTASIVASFAKRSGGRGAAIVLDADTGEVLASASYPWPDSRSTVRASLDASTEADALLDRARYGLYPPGSTFKLVTASAALREHDQLQNTTFTCSRLPDGRVGARIPGWNRAIRDDVLDSIPHGNIDLHDGLVRSCNAYFAQLAVKLGPDPLLAAATELGISLTPAADARTRIRATLPLIGYGQGDVVATPLRMARVGAAIASGGALRDVRWQTTASPPNPELSEASAAFLTPDSARLLGRYMRDAVLTGTGRSLRDHAGHIAGKTGTAELSGKPSHSWFVGFAPYDSPTRRIAFAVILENAGYGSANAAPAAGEIVSAAAEAGLLK